MYYLATLDHARLFSAAYGDPSNPPILLLHGLGADHEMWRPQIERYPQESLFVIAPDLRGHGRSEKPTVFTIAACARDLRDLLDQLEIERTAVVGVSMGGLVAQQFALDYPERLSRLVIADSFSCVRRPLERFNAWLGAFLLHFFPLRLQAYLIRLTYRRLGATRVGEYLSDSLLAVDPQWTARLREQVNRFDVCDRLGEIKVPTLVLVGTAFGNLAIEMARTTAAGIPGAVFETLPGGGDPSNLLVPQAFDQAVLRFLRS